MERMESMEPISAYYTTAYPEIQPDSGCRSGEATASQPRTPPALTYDEELVHKTILVGDSGVGKTSLLVQFDQGKFIPGSFSATVGIGFTNKVVTVDGVNVKLQIWDTAGQERFRSVTHAYYRDAHALCIWVCTLPFSDTGSGSRHLASSDHQPMSDLGRNSPPRIFCRFQTWLCTDFSRRLDVPAKRGSWDPERAPNYVREIVSSLCKS
ncbi:uncharacterized protein LOC114845763 isoform X4 [Betta splendens]|uniref:Uncharacterized protein LOC114845763 isoform X4 n=1 Tax=Betta splendens TaxID=158456 RepID=A0A9W2XFB3_BETSP|nr:uncharacterized protein LOC114845763 isoform X4 [Betta splendens]